MKFRPSLVPTIFVAIGLIILLNLGFWQLRRNTERKTHLDRVEMRLDAAPATSAELAAVPSDAPQETWNELSWRKANLSGHFIDQPPIYLAGRFEFGLPGYDLLQPFTTEDGQTLWVVRGWIPSSEWQELTAETNPGTETTLLQGLLIEPLGEGDEQPIPATETHPPRYPRDAFAAVRDASDITTIPLVLVVGQQLDAGVTKSRESYPVTGYVPKPKSLPHLQYAITWFLIAGTLITIWGVSAVRRGARLAAE